MERERPCLGEGGVTSAGAVREKSRPPEMGPTQPLTLTKVQGTLPFWELLGRLPRGRVSQRGERNQSKVRT